MFKYLSKSIIFILIFCVLYTFLPNVFEKSRDAKKWEYIYNESNKINTLFMGSSLIFTSINPNIIDPLLNQESFILGSSGQNIIQSYYNLIEVLNYQKPQKIILDVNTFLINKENQKTGLIYNNLSGMKLSKNKINSFLNTIHNKGILNDEKKIEFNKMSFYEKYDFIITLITKERFNWKNKLKKITFNKKKSPNVKNKGFLEKESKISLIEYNNFLKNRDTQKNKIISDENIYFLEKFIFLCEKNNLDLIFIKTPTLLNININNQLDYYIDNHTIKYYDYESHFNQINFTKDDFYDESHLSKYGAEKFSYYFATTF